MPENNYLSKWSIRGVIYWLKDLDARSAISTINDTLTSLSTSVSNKLSKSGDTMTGDLNMNANVVMGSGKKIIMNSTSQFNS